MAADKSMGRPLPKSTKEKRDDDIMLTNDSSIVSKRSVVKLYHADHPDFFRPFVGKHPRRHPLINRGYWLRMRAVEHTVKNFLQEPSDREKVVINLGCGHDPLPFILLHKYPELAGKATFVDVDYPQLMHKKRACIARDDELQAIFPFLKSGTTPTPDLWKAGPYFAVGCDLRQLSHLQRILEEQVQIHDRAVLFVAEVSIAYMDVKSADSVITWASYFKDARFCILEQTLPDGPNHPFAKTLLSHFAKLQAHLKVVYEYPTLGAQKRRFLNIGWAQANVKSLWELWTDEDFMNTADRQALDKIEPFDEWEEFALYANHYLLLVARTEAAAIEAKSATTGAQDPRAPEVPIQTQAKLEKSAQTQDQTVSRRFGALFRIGQNLHHHGGYGAQTRLHDCDVYSATGDFEGSKELPAKLPLMCHTITNLNDHESLLVCGRTSPNRAASECWLLTNQTYSRVDDLNPARYRHCAAPIRLPAEGIAEQGVLVFGGKTGTGEVLQDWHFWSNERGWQSVRSDDPLPAPRFGAAMAVFEGSTTSGVLMGGMTSDGLVIGDIWEWRLHWDNGVHVTCKNRTDELGQTQNLEYGRFGATLVPCPELGEASFLLIGGIAKDRLQKWEDEIIVIKIHERLSLSRLSLPRPESVRPLFVGVDAAKLSGNKVLLAGGGAVCFAMGSFTNTSSALLTINPATPTAITPDTVAKSRSGEEVYPATDSTGLNVTDVQRVRVETEEDFEDLVSKGQPVIIEGLDIGACTQLWTPEYLKERIGPERRVIVGSHPTEKMTSMTKSHSSLEQPFGEFMDGVSAGGTMYLRSVVDKQPTKLHDDFPTLAPDFQLPSALSRVARGLHSSPVRISGAVAPWLHYDVLANVVFQIRGTRRLRLFAPADAPQLAYAPGASRSNADAFAPELARTLRPLDALLRPGDALFLPAMWSHGARPEDGPSIAVKCFWRDLEPGTYAASGDVVGYEEGRKAIDGVAQAFEGLPRELRVFYAGRLAAELKEKVGGR